MLQPLPDSQWDRFALAHLLKRAGFGLTGEEWRDWGTLSMREAVDRLVDWEATPDPAVPPAWTQNPPDRTAEMRQLRQLPEQQRRERLNELRREQFIHLVDLQGWWLNRMLRTPRPLQEKLALFWHGHFATSFEKVKNATLMWQQNDLFRRTGNGSYEELLVAVGRDPAMLIWLDGGQSSAQAPNENYGRELLELFTLGEGHYGEDDIQAVAKAYTGWRVNRFSGQVHFSAAQHDNGGDRLLGEKVRNDTEVVEAILDEKQAARYLVRKLWAYFAETEPDDGTVDELAGTLKSSKYEMKPVLKQLFASAAFYAPAVRQHQIKSPVQWLIGTLKLAGSDQVPVVLALPLLKQMGQEPFLPPNVKGWDGGRTWISTNTLLLRYNAAKLFIYGGDATGLAEGGLRIARAMGEEMEKAGGGATGQNRRGFVRQLVGRARDYPALFDPGELVPDAERKDAAAMSMRLAEAFYLAPPSGALLEKLASYVDAGGGVVTDDTVRGLFYLMMTRPEYQLT